MLALETMAPDGNHLDTCAVTFEAEFASGEKLLKERTPSVWNEIQVQSTSGLSHSWQQPHVRHHGVLVPELFTRSGHRGHESSTCLSCQRGIQVHAQLSGNLWSLRILAIFFILGYDMANVSTHQPFVFLRSSQSRIERGGVAHGGACHISPRTVR